MKSLLFLLILYSSAFAQKTFELKNASQYFDIKIAVAKCEETSCRGKATFAFFKKGTKTPYQEINLPDTYVELDEKGKPEVNKTLLYDKQSVVNIGDFNFDGMEDVALCEGTHGSYGMPAYRIFLSSRAAGKFVYDKNFSALGKHLGMFEVNPKRKVLRTFDKSGCCWHITEEYSVVNNAPKKILEVVEDATSNEGTKVKITTKKLVGGKWQTNVKMVARKE